MSFTPGAGTRFLAFSTTNPSSGSTTLPGPLSITGGTVTANNPVLSATQTWNNAAVTFTGWQLNVTDTASAAASLLMDLQVGGSSRFRIDKSGAISVSGAFGYANSGIAFIGSTPRLYANSTFFAVNNNSFGAIGCEFGAPAQVRINGGVAFGFSSSDVGASLDVALARDAANTLAQRNGVNAQTLRVYNTFTDASNYERGIFSWVSNVLFIGNEGAGTGATRGTTVTGSIFKVRISGVDRWVFDASSLRPFVGNSYDIGGTADTVKNLFQAGYHQMVEMTAPAAPAANSVRIYAEDNGSGKTRLMALFATGAAQQIAIEP